MQTVQASVSSAITPRARGTGISFSVGYITVGGFLNMAFSVNHMPCHRPTNGNLI